MSKVFRPYEPGQMLLMPDQEGHNQMVTTFYAAFSDAQYTTWDMIAEGDEVVVR